MRAFWKAGLIGVAILLQAGIAVAQSVELYAGHERVGVDLMWFKNFRNRQEERSPVLYFSRNRASTDYTNATTAFGSVNAVSYNFKNGLGIVGVGNFLNGGFTPKAGVQLYKQKGTFLFFGWLVADVKEKGNVDLFGLFRYQPPIRENLRLFTQVELFPIYHPSSGIWYLTQRLRLGLRYRDWAAGCMADFQQVGKHAFTSAYNLGGFLRHDF